MNENRHLGEFLHLMTLEALADRPGINLENTEYVRVLPNGIAILDLIGPIYPRANMQTEMSGAVSIQKYVSDFAKAYAEPEIIGIVQRGDTPGGDVRGIGDGAKMIRSIMAKNEKPVWTFAEGYLASAGYYIGSTSEQVYGSESSMSGSIGVVLSGRKNDDDTIEIVSSQSPNKRPDAGTPDGRAVLQEQVDDLASVFVKDVAKYRNIKKDDVLANYGQGKVMFGPRAQKAGLLDGVTTLNDLVAKMARERKTSRMAVGAAAGWSSETIMSFQALNGENHTAQITSGMTEEIVNMGFSDSWNRLKAAVAPTTKTVEETDAEAGDNQGQASATVSDAIAGLTPEQLLAKRQEIMDASSDAGELFATKLMTASKISGYEQPQAMLDFCNARADDKLVGGKVQFVNEKGELVEGTREEACAARYNNRQPHALTTPAVKQVTDATGVAATVQQPVATEPVVLTQSAPDKQEVAEKEPTPERVTQLLGSSSQGQVALRNREANK